MIELVMQYVAVIAGPIAAVWALLQWGDSIRQRKREFRWRQVDTGRQLTDELFDDPIAGDGLEIIDEELDRITLKDGTSAAISPHDIKAAMAFDSQEAGDAGRADQPQPGPDPCPALEEARIGAGLKFQPQCLQACQIRQWLEHRAEVVKAGEAGHVPLRPPGAAVAWVG